MNEGTKQLKGTVVATWIQTAKNLWGNEITVQAMQKAGWAPEKLHDMMARIVEFKVVIGHFSEDVNQYRT
jgi:hypothetical protein